MKGEWCCFEKHFSASDCQIILDRTQSLPLSNGALGVQGVAADEKIRKSKVKWLEVDQFQDVFSEMWKVAKKANDYWFGFDLKVLKLMQLAEYDSEYKGKYSKHQDVFWVNPTEYHRKLTCVLQLTDPTQYTGGELELFDCDVIPDQNTIRSQGTVICFPSFKYHQVKPVTSGVRHSLTCWFEGPKWR